MAFLLANWKLVTIVVLLAVIASTGVYVSILKSNIVALEAEKITLTTKLEVSNASIAALRSSINDQNAAIEVFKGAADAREKLSREEIAKAKVESTNQKKRANAIMGKVIPKDATACEAANRLFNEEIKNGK